MADIRRSSGKLGEGILDSKQWVCQEGVMVLVLLESGNGHEEISLGCKDQKLYAHTS